MTILNQIDCILTKQQLEDDYKELNNIEKIAKKYGISSTAIKSRLIKYDIKIHTKIHRYECDHSFFSHDNEKVFYLAGFIAADGCIFISKTNKERNHTNYRVVISLSAKDKDFLSSLREAIGCQNPIKTYLHKRKNEKYNDSLVSKLAISSKQMVMDLQRFNIGPRKSLIYDMPQWLIEHPLVHHFLRGYNDGDGSFFISSNNENNHITFSLRGTIPFLNNVKNIFESNNINTKSIPRESGGIGQFSIHSNTAVSSITDFLYRDATIFMPRKYNIAKKSGEILKIKEDFDNKMQQILRNN